MKPLRALVFIKKVDKNEKEIIECRFIKNADRARGLTAHSIMFLCKKEEHDLYYKQIEIYLAAMNRRDDGRCYYLDSFVGLPNFPLQVTY